MLQFKLRLFVLFLLVLFIPVFLVDTHNQPRPDLLIILAHEENKTTDVTFFVISILGAVAG